MSQRIQKRGGSSDSSGSPESELIIAGYDFTHLAKNKSWISDEDMTLEVLKLIFKAASGVPAVDLTRSGVARELFEYVSDPVNAMSEVLLPLVTKERLLLENVFSIFKAMIVYRVVDAPLESVRNVKEGLMLQADVKRELVLEAFREICEYRSPSPSFPRFIKHMLSLNGAEWDTEALVLYKALWPVLKASAKKAGEVWKSLFKTFCETRFLWTARRLNFPDSAGFLWALGELVCGFDLQDYVRVDLTWRTTDLADDVSTWMKDRCDTSGEEIARISSLLSAADAYHMLQVGLLFGLVLPVLLQDIIGCILSFLYFIGDRSDGLKLELAGGVTAPRSLVDCTRLLANPMPGKGYSAWTYAGGRTRVQDIAALFSPVGGLLRRATGNRVVEIEGDDIEEFSSTAPKQKPQTAGAQKKLSATNNQIKVAIKKAEEEEREARRREQEEEDIAASLEQLEADSDMESDNDEMERATEASMLEEERELLARASVLKRQRESLNSANQAAEATGDSDVEHSDDEAGSEMENKVVSPKGRKDEVTNDTAVTTKEPTAKKAKKSRAKGCLLTSMFKAKQSEIVLAPTIGVLGRLLATNKVTYSPLLLRCTEVLHKLFGEAKALTSPPAGTMAAMLEQLYEVVEGPPAVNAIMMMCKGKGDWPARVLAPDSRDTFTRLGEMEQALFQVVRVAPQHLVVKMVLHLGAAQGDTCRWPAKGAEATVEYPPQYQCYVTPVGELAEAYEAVRDLTEHPHATVNEGQSGAHWVSNSNKSTGRSVGAVVNAQQGSRTQQTPQAAAIRPAATLPSVKRSGGERSVASAGASSLSSTSGKFSAISSTTRGLGLFAAEEGEEVESLVQSRSTPVVNRSSTSSAEPTYAALNSAPVSATMLSVPDRFNERHLVTRNVELTALYTRAETLKAAGSQKRVRELTGTEKGSFMDPASLNVDNMLTRATALYFEDEDRHETDNVCHAELLCIVLQPDQALTLSALLLEFTPAILMREGKVCILLRHFLPRDEHGNWSEVNTHELLLLAVRGVGHWLFYLLRWQNVVSCLLDELAGRVFNRFSIRYFTYEFHNALASIPARARNIKVLSEDIDEASMYDFVAKLDSLKVKMTREGSEMLYESLRGVAPGGPGVDTLIGKPHAAVAATPAVVHAPVAPVPAPRERETRQLSRSRSRERGGRDRDQRGGGRQQHGGSDRRSDRGGDRHQRDERGGDRHQRDDRGGAHGDRSKVYCLADFAYQLHAADRSCQFAGRCWQLHLKKVRETLRDHPLTKVVEEIEDSDLPAKLANKLVKAVRSHEQSPWSGKK